MNQRGNRILFMISHRNFSLDLSCSIPISPRRPLPHSLSQVGFGVSEVKYRGGGSAAVVVETKNGKKPGVICKDLNLNCVDLRDWDGTSQSTCAKLVRQSFIHYYIMPTIKFCLSIVIWQL
jgi:hypothetical protein